MNLRRWSTKISVDLPKEIAVARRTGPFGKCRYKFAKERRDFVKRRIGSSRAHGDLGMLNSPNIPKR